MTNPDKVGGKKQKTLFSDAQKGSGKAAVNTKPGKTVT
jgi:hypothetical protein